MNNKFLVALEDPLSSVNGVGCLIPLRRSELLIISNEFEIK